MGLNGLPGGGPWRVLHECPAFFHNTAYAAKKRRDEAKCICPRALVRLAETKALTIQRRIERGERKIGPGERQRGGRPHGNTDAQYFRNIRDNVPVPDLSAGKCRSPLGLYLMDQAQESRWTGSALADAKAMCEYCPVKRACLGWVERAENPPGDWPGIYGGKTHMQRRNEWRKTGANHE